MASRTPADSARDAGESPLRSPSEARETLDNRNHEAREAARGSPEIIHRLEVFLDPGIPPTGRRGVRQSQGFGQVGGPLHPKAAQNRTYGEPAA